MELKGSEKQVKWASEIREAKLAELSELIAKAIAEVRTGRYALCADDYQAALDSLYTRVADVDSAAWWIDKRYLFNGAYRYSPDAITFEFSESKERHKGALIAPIMAQFAIIAARESAIRKSVAREKVRLGALCNHRR